MSLPTPSADTVIRDYPYAPPSAAEGSFGPYPPAQPARQARRRLSTPFKLALALLFVRVSYIHEAAAFEAGRDPYVLYIVALPAIVAFLSAGGAARAFRDRGLQLWLAFLVWMVITMPFSFWRGGSFDTILGFVKSGFILTVLFSGLRAPGRASIAILKCGFLGTIGTLLFAFIYGRGAEGRMVMQFGIMANSNDFAAHLTFLLPILLFPIFTPKQPFWMKVLALPSALGAIYIILSTGSRGAFVALIAQAVLMLFASNWRVRSVISIVTAAGAVVIALTIPDAVLDRLATTFSNSNDSSNEAVASTQSRIHLFNESIRLTIENPIFGVGVGQFSSALGAAEGVWLSTHNSFTQVSSESGVLGVVLFLAAIGSSLMRMNRVRKKTLRKARFKIINGAATCALGGSIGFCAAASFLNVAYLQYFPMMTILAIHLEDDLRFQIENLPPNQQPAPAVAGQRV